MTMPKFEPVAYMQLSVEEGVDTYFPRLHKPEKYNKDWWRFDPLHSADQLTEAYEAGAASRDAEVNDWRSQAHRSQSEADNAIAERDQLREQVALLREEVTRCRDWFEAQAKVKSKGSPSSWELVLLRDERDAADEALAATEPKIAKPS